MDCIDDSFRIKCEIADTPIGRIRNVFITKESGRYVARTPDGKFVGAWREDDLVIPNEAHSTSTELICRLMPNSPSSKLRDSQNRIDPIFETSDFGELVPMNLDKNVGGANKSC